MEGSHEGNDRTSMAIVDVIKTTVAIEDMI